MKPLITLTLVILLLTPAVAFADGATDAALGLGAFAVFNQILSGTGIFGGFYAPAPVVVAPPVRARAVIHEYDYYPAPVPSYAPRHVHIPPGHYPPPGHCRVWYSGRPPGHQPPPFRCN
jgi:hypothetical protein